MSEKTQKDLQSQLQKISKKYHLTVPDVKAIARAINLDARNLEKYTSHQVFNEEKEKILNQFREIKLKEVGANWQEVINNLKKKYPELAKGYYGLPAYHQALHELHDIFVNRNIDVNNLVDKGYSERFIPEF